MNYKNLPKQPLQESCFIKLTQTDMHYKFYNSTANIETE